MVSKGLHILDILAQKKNHSIKLVNPYINLNTNINQIKQLSAIDVFMLPTHPICYAVKLKVKT
jgi:hypothetical protein